MSRLVVVVCAVGLWASPVAAQALKLAPPTLTTRTDRCSEQLRTLCQGLGKRAVESELSCEPCTPLPMPAEVVAPKGAASGSKHKLDGECTPRASGPLPSWCAPAPRLDNIPRP